MARRTEIHVVPTPDGRWGTRLPGRDGIVSLHETRKGAIEEGRREARASQMELVVHDINGGIREGDGGGHAPFPSRGIA